MPGPGGGGRGGGGRGGFRGGSRGGSFGGGHHHHHYGRGAGCCSGILGLPFYIIFLVIYLIFSSGGAEHAFSSDRYDEVKFQDYADSQYAAEFGSSSAYEDNLLLTVLVDDEEYYSYYYIAWIGDHVADEINALMGNNNTVLGQVMEENINSASYKYSLDSDLARVVDTMGALVSAMDLENSFTCSEDHVQVKSHLTNHSSVVMTESTVNDALTGFTETTGIPIVIVVEDMDAVFSHGLSSGGSGIWMIVIAALVIAVAVIVFSILRQKKQDAGFDYVKKYTISQDFDE